MALIINPEVRNCLDYDPESGLITRKISRHRSRIGQPVGGLDCRGYLRVGVLGCYYSYHRLAYFLYHGEVPEIVDHANGDKTDNRIVNLRAATPAQSTFNRRGFSSSLPKGVTLHAGTGKYQAQIKCDGVNHYLGLFATTEEAHAAYSHAALHFHGDFARLA